MTRFLVLFLLSSLFCASSSLADELVVVKAVSKSKKTFVLPKGYDEGVRVGQKRAFTTDKISLIARVVEAKHDMSLWEIVEKNAIIPFNRDDVVVLTSTSESIWTDIARIEKDFKTLSDKYGPEQVDKNYIITRGSLTKGLSEATSETSADQETTRNGFQLEAIYSSAMKAYPIDLGLGLRYDRDAINVSSNSSFTILNTRLMLVGELQYNFEYVGKLNGNFYTGAAVGYGKSSSTVEETSSTGPATLLPCVRVGFRQDFETYNMLYEAAMESLTMSEEFEDGTTQKTNLVNVKFSLGVRF